MSWILDVRRRSLRPATISKYEVTAYRAGASGALGPFQFELERKAILTDLERLIPHIETSAMSYRAELEAEEIKPLDALTTLGKRMFFTLATDVRESIDHADSIHLLTNDVEIPWEVMHNGEGFFCLKHSLGISPIVKKRFGGAESKVRGMMRILFIVDTKNDLPQTHVETQKIISLLENHGKAGYLVLKGEEATYSHVRTTLLRNHFDIVHVAAHVKFEETAPEESGVVLNDGRLRAREFYSTIESEPPWLVFVNSCKSAKTKDLSYFQKYSQLSSLAFAFVAAGASSYIGTTCLVNDKSASELAVSFYINLLSGLSVGESLRKAKVEFFRNHPNDLSWSAFTLYGDPNSKPVFEEGRDVESEVKAYISRKKGSFTISECAKELGVAMSEVRAIVSRLTKKE